MPIHNPAPGMSVIENAYPESAKFLADIIETAELEYSPSGWRRSQTGQGTLGDYRSSVESDFTQLLCSREPEYEALVQSTRSFQQTLDELVNEFKSVYDLGLCSDEGLRCIRYQNKAEYRIHHDHAELNMRALSMVMFLNDDFKGGQLEFPYFDVTIQPKAGQMILFPSNFPYAHIAHPVEEGTKYTLVTWFR